MLRLCRWQGWLAAVALRTFKQALAATASSMGGPPQAPQAAMPDQHPGCPAPLTRLHRQSPDLQHRADGALLGGVQHDGQ